MSDGVGENIGASGILFGLTVFGQRGDKSISDVISYGIAWAGIWGSGSSGSSCSSSSF